MTQVDLPRTDWKSPKLADVQTQLGRNGRIQNLGFDLNISGLAIGISALGGRDESQPEFRPGWQRTQREFSFSAGETDRPRLRGQESIKVQADQTIKGALGTGSEVSPTCSQVWHVQ